MRTANIESSHEPLDIHRSIRIAELFVEFGAAALILRADGFVDHSVERRVVTQDNSQAFTQVFDRALIAVSTVDSRLREVPIVLVPHSLAIAKSIAYAKSENSRNRDRIKGMVALSPADVQGGFGKPSFVNPLARALVRLGLGNIVLPPKLLNLIGRKNVDWGITIRSAAALGTKGGPLDVVHPENTTWIEDLESNLKLNPNACHVLIGELDELHGSTDEVRSQRVAALVKLIRAQTSWSISEVAGASHSFQSAGSGRADPAALLFDEAALRDVLDRILVTVRSARS